eukprot:SAG31_NODE_5110_length_2738_cov_1.601743_2_plen_217_part_00
MGQALSKARQLRADASAGLHMATTLRRHYVKQSLSPLQRPLGSRRKMPASSAAAGDDEPLLKKQLASIKSMSKGQLKKMLQKQGLSTSGNHEKLRARMLEAHQDIYMKKKAARAAKAAKSAAARAEAEAEAEAERKEWEKEEELIARESAAQEAAIAHMKNLNAEFAAMKKPALQQEMRSRGLDDVGKKADMLERLAQHLEAEQVSASGKHCYVLA